MALIDLASIGLSLGGASGNSRGLVGFSGATFALGCDPPALTETKFYGPTVVPPPASRGRDAAGLHAKAPTDARIATASRRIPRLLSLSNAARSPAPVQPRVRLQLLGRQCEPGVSFIS